MMLYFGKGFKIRFFEHGDEASLALHANNIKIWEQVRDKFPHPYTFDDALVWVELNTKASKQVNFAIVADDEVIGSIGIIQGTDVFKKNIEVGYWLSEDYWGRGITTEALNWLKVYCTQNFDAHRIWASVFSQNYASARVLEKCSFKHEATLKESVFKSNGFLDELIYSFIVD